MSNSLATHDPADTSYSEAKAELRATLLATAARIAASGREPTSSAIARAARMSPGAVRSVRLEMMQEGTWVIPARQPKGAATIVADRRAKNQRSRDRAVKRCVAKARAKNPEIAPDLEAESPRPDISPEQLRLLDWVAARPHGCTAGEAAQAMGLLPNIAKWRLVRLRNAGLVGETDIGDDDCPLVVWTRTKEPAPVPSRESPEAIEAREAARRARREELERRRDAIEAAQMERDGAIKQACEEIRAGWSPDKLAKAEGVAPVEFRPMRRVGVEKRRSEH